MFKNSLIGLLLLFALLSTGCIITGKVCDENGNGIEGVTVILSGAANLTTTTDSNGGYIFGNFFDWILGFNVDSLNIIMPGDYTVTPYKQGYSFLPNSSDVSVTENWYGPLNTSFAWPVGGVNFESSGDPILAKTELLVGDWHFYYTIVNTWHDYYSLNYISGDYNSQGGYYIYGTDEWEGQVIAEYWPDDGFWSLLSEGTDIDQYYEFYTNGSTVLPNSCYYQINNSTGDWSNCYTLYGSKTEYISAVAAQKTIDSSAIALDEREHQQLTETKILKDKGETSSVIDQRTVDGYLRLKERLDSLE